MLNVCLLLSTLTNQYTNFWSAYAIWVVWFVCYFPENSWNAQWTLCVLLLQHCNAPMWNLSLSLSNYNSSLAIRVDILGTILAHGLPECSLIFRPSLSPVLILQIQWEKTWKNLSSIYVWWCHEITFWSVCLVLHHNTWHIFLLCILGDQNLILEAVWSGTRLPGICTEGTWVSLQYVHHSSLMLPYSKILMPLSFHNKSFLGV